MDEAVRKLAALGLPGVILLITISSTGLAGAAAITAALAVLGPAGMLGGILFLGVVGIAGDFVSKVGLEAALKAVYLERMRQGSSIDQILGEIDQLLVSSDMKRFLKEAVRKP